VKLALQLVPYGETQRLLLAKDITHEMRLETVRRTFVANASHELRSPLTVISGYLDALAEDPDLAEHWRGPVDEMVRQSERMRRIIEDLLTLSRLEASAPEAERDYVDVAGMLAVLRKEALARPERPATVELRLESDASGCWGVESEIFSAFANIIGNALKYTPARAACASAGPRRRRGLPVGHGHRGRHSRRLHPAPDGALLPRRQEPRPRHRRHRPRPRDRQARAAAPRRAPRGPQQAGRGQRLHLPFPRRSGTALRALRICSQHLVAAR
jgi:nitrogen-specific signal transduction histidine kinase